MSRWARLVYDFMDGYLERGNSTDYFVWSRASTEGKR